MTRGYSHGYKERTHVVKRILYFGQNRVQSSVIFVNRKKEKKCRPTVQIQTDEHLRHRIMLSGEVGRLNPTTYGGQDFGNGGNQEPNDTLVNGEYHVSSEHHGHQ